jgi:riboflavin synthase
MFTGLVEGLGEIKAIKQLGKGMMLDISANFSIDNPKKGESIAVNGICLTATEINEKSFALDVSPETLSRSSLHNLKTGVIVNLERALRPTDRLGGHIVSGHIDCVGNIKNIKNLGEFTIFDFFMPNEFSKYVVEKGSVTIDGISLTVNNCKNNTFSVSIIPHTIKITNLQFRKIGDIVNLEFDIIGKYVEKLMNWKQGGVSMDLLRKQGFLDYQ